MIEHGIKLGYPRDLAFTLLQGTTIGRVLERKWYLLLLRRLRTMTLNQSMLKVLLISITITCVVRIIMLTKLTMSLRKTRTMQ